MAGTIRPHVAIIATGSLADDTRIAALCRAHGLLVNVVDRPELCDFIFPAVLQRGDVQIAVSTGGRAPVLTRWLKNRIAAMLPSGLGRVAALGEEFRSVLKTSFPSMKERKDFWEKLLESGFAEKAGMMNNQESSAAFQTAIDEGRAAAGKHETGIVYLIGAGPGDPDLLTFKALRLLQAADVVLYDRLVTPDILALARKDAEKIYVGKQRANHCMPQEEINALLVSYARRGLKVARLKGGDPLLFGRGGEEAEALQAAHIPYVIVPGVTSASGAAAYAGFPLTHRDHAQAVTFVTGHMRGDGELVLPWASLAAAQQTLVIYMGLHKVNVLVEKLLAHGLAKDTPVAAVSQATWPTQRIIRATLLDLPRCLREQPLDDPALLIIGAVTNITLE
ncbi:MAG: siroheme synthase CysG [Holosporales bacterium]